MNKPNSPWSTQPLLRFMSIALAFTALASLAAAGGKGKAKLRVQASKPQWQSYAGNPQHTGVSPVPAQSLRSILWSTPVDLQPQYSGTNLFAHYGSPVCTKNNTVVYPVKLGKFNDYRLEARRGSDGTLLWQKDLDYKLPDPNKAGYSWTLPMGPAMTFDGKLVIPGAGGTILVRSNPDSANGTYTRLCFYGLSNYTSDITSYNNTVFIVTPLTVDSTGAVYFGYVVTGSTPTGLRNGWARVDLNGNAASIATVDALNTLYSNTGWTTGTGQTLLSAAPALSNDESLVYVVGMTSPYSADHASILALDRDSLAVLGGHALKTPPNATSGAVRDAYPHPDGTACPMVGPDGDVYIGTWLDDNGYRGYMLHFDSTLGTVKPAGAFGWDDTPSVIPKSMVPSYHGTSEYLIMTKYNNYAGAGEHGDGLNKLGILDPNATQVDAYGRTVMKEVLTVIGPTPDPDHGAKAVREWCINTAAVDVANKSVIVNCEDGTAYRWNLVTNTLSEKVPLTTGIGEAYTSTIIGADGISYAISNVVLYALWDGVYPTAATAVKKTVVGGADDTVHINLSVPAGIGGTKIAISISDTSVTGPSTVLASANATGVDIPLKTKFVEANRTVTITASRYGHSASANVTLLSTAATAITPAATSVVGGNGTTATVTIANSAPAGGRVVNLSRNNTCLTVPASVTVAAGHTTASFPITTGGVASTQSVLVSAVTGATKVSTTVSVTPAALATVSASPTTVVGGTSTKLTLTLDGAPPSGGATVGLSYGGNISGPSSVVIGSSKTASVTVNAANVSAKSSAVVTCTYKGTTKSATLSLVPYAVEVFTITPNAVNMTYGATASISFNAPAPTGGTDVTISSPTHVIGVPATAHVNEGFKGTTFKITTTQVAAAITKSVTVSANGFSKSAALTVNPIGLASLSLASSSVTGGALVAGTITLATKAGSSSIQVLTSSSNSVAASVKSSALVGSGKVSVNFTVVTHKVNSPTTVTITAKLGSSTVSKTLTVNP